MKRVMLIVTLLMLCAGVAFAGEFYTAPNSTSDAVLPKKAGWPTINSINFEATNATGDVIIYGGDNTSTLATVGKAATATTFAVTSCTGIDDADVVVIIQKQIAGSLDRVMEATVASACNDTTDIITVGSTANAYSGTNNFTFYEMQVVTTLSDVGTTAITYGPGGPLWGGKNNWPMAVRITAGTINWMSGEWR